MKVKLKICGMKDRDNILDVSKTLPDYMGFIFYGKSPRYVGQNFKIPTIPKAIKKVGVFVNERVSVIKETVERHKLDFVQLHGEESVEDCKQLLSNVRIIKVFSIDDAFNFQTVRPYCSVSDFFLFDTQGRYYGGNGKTFDWIKLHQYDQKVPFFLSGGLRAENIEQVRVLQGMNIHGLDVNSGVEILPGVKSVKRIEELRKKLEYELQG